jgi:hypothetical protein
MTQPSSRLLSSSVNSSRVLAMQKVVGSSPIIRFHESPLETAGFSAPRLLRREPTNLTWNLTDRRPLPASQF